MPPDTQAKNAKRSSKLIRILSGGFGRLKIGQKDRAQAPSAIGTAHVGGSSSEHDAGGTASGQANTAGGRTAPTGSGGSEVALFQGEATAVAELSKLEALPDKVLVRIANMVKTDMQPDGWYSTAGYKEEDVYQRMAQNSLVAFMCTSKRLFHIVSPILYADIISDDFSALLYGLAIWEDGDRLSSRKQALMRHCRSLTLEPCRFHLDAWEGDPTPVEAILLVTTVVTNAFRAALDAGGLDVLFPKLERLSTSAYSGKRQTDRVYGPLWLEMLADDLYAAWWELLNTCSAPARCCNVMRLYPLHGYAPEPLAAKRSLIESSKAGHDRRPPINYVHMAYGTRFLDIRYNVRTVYLIGVSCYLGLDPRRELLTWVGNQAINILRRAQDPPIENGRPPHERDLYLDIEFRIPIVYIREMENLGVDMATCVDANLERIMSWYNKEGGKTNRRIKDSWTIRVTDFVHCPACKVYTSLLESFWDREHYVKTMTWDWQKEAQV